MLVLERREDEGVTVNGPCRVVVVSIERGRVRLGFEAERSVKILRDDAVIQRIREKGIDE